MQLISQSKTETSEFAVELHKIEETDKVFGKSYAMFQDRCF